MKYPLQYTKDSDFRTQCSGQGSGSEGIAWHSKSRSAAPVFPGGRRRPWRRPMSAWQPANVALPVRWRRVKVLAVSAAVFCCLPFLGLGSCVFDPSVSVPSGRKDAGIDGDGPVDGPVVLADGLLLPDATPRPDAGPDGALADSGRDGAVADRDNDGIPDDVDNCPDVGNFDQADSDGDGLGDVCDNCPDETNAGQQDGDGDAVGDDCDNCSNVANSDQADMDRDELGDACDEDRDGDGIANVHDPRPDHVDTVVYYGAGSSLGDDLSSFSVEGGWWAAGRICGGLNAGSAIASIQGNGSAGNVVVQTGMTGVVGNPSGQPWPSAGLVARWDSTQSTGYLCVVDLRNHHLVIGKYDPNWVELSAVAGVPAGSEYVLRFRLEGANLTCTLLPDNISTSFSDSQFSAGKQGFFRYYTSACFEYLTVISTQ